MSFLINKIEKCHCTIPHQEGWKTSSRFPSSRPWRGIVRQGFSLVIENVSISSKKKQKCCWATPVQLARDLLPVQRFPQPVFILPLCLPLQPVSCHSPRHYWVHCSSTSFWKEVESAKIHTGDRSSCHKDRQHWVTFTCYKHFTSSFPGCMLFFLLVMRVCH